MKHLDRSVQHYDLARSGAMRTEETSAMRLGSLVHCGRLEPAAIAARYVVMPDFAATLRRPNGDRYESPRGTTAYKALVQEFREQHPNAIVVDQSSYDTMLGIVEALAAHDRARLYLSGPGPVEVSIIWDDPDTGMRVKARIDKVNTSQAVIVDLKTDHDPLQFERHIIERGYHAQAALYRRGWQVLTGQECDTALVTAETARPYGVRAALLSDELLESGEALVRRRMDKLVAAHQIGVGEVYESPDEWRLPAWAERQQDAALTMGGKRVDW
jgi:hypothetical protein